MQIKKNGLHFDIENIETLDGPKVACKDWKDIKSDPTNQHADGAGAENPGHPPPQQRHVQIAQGATWRKEFVFDGVTSVWCSIYCGRVVECFGVCGPYHRHANNIY